MLFEVTLLNRNLSPPQGGVGLALPPAGGPAAGHHVGPVHLRSRGLRKGVLPQEAQNQAIEAHIRQGYVTGHFFVPEGHLGVSFHCSFTTRPYEKYKPLLQMYS